MKKLYLEYFKVSDNSKITDKAMLGRVIVTVAVMLVCVIAMSFKAFAFFTAEVSSTIHVSTATFEVETAVDGKPIDIIGTPNGEHTITISVKNTSTVTTGYCVVSVGEGKNLKQYITQQFIRDENGNYNTVTFTINLAEPTLVTVEARWGTSTASTIAINDTTPENYIVDGATVVITNNDTSSQTQGDNLSGNLGENTDGEGSAVEGEASSDGVDETPDLEGETPDGEQQEDVLQQPTE